MLFFGLFLSNEKEHNKETVCEIAFGISSCKYRIWNDADPL